MQGEQNLSSSAWMSFPNGFPILREQTWADGAWRMAGVSESIVEPWLGGGKSALI